MHLKRKLSFLVRETNVSVPARACKTAGGVKDLQFLNNGGHLGVVGHLAIVVPALLDAADAEAGDVATEDARD